MIVADHGLALIYFLQSSVVPQLVEGGAEVLVLVEDELADVLRDRWGSDEVQFEGLRLDQASTYQDKVWPEIQWWLHFLRRVGASDKINTEAMDSYIRQVWVEQPNRRRILMPFAWLIIALLRRSRLARGTLVRLQGLFRPSIYSDLLESFQPDLVVASSPGWRLDRYLLREAAEAGIPTATVIMGWDNPSSYALPGARVDFATCWSEIQKAELTKGSDWSSSAVNVGGIPTYDGYFEGRWMLSREEYFDRHSLDPDRVLLGYACSFVTFSPNYPNIAALADLVIHDGLSRPAQLLIRLHPNHFLESPLYKSERKRINELAEQQKHIHVVRPVPLAEGMGYYSGEDMDEKSSMMAYSDVFLTVYSTMVVEAAAHGRPIVSVCIDDPQGWNTPRKYSLPLSEIGGWPTHERFRDSGAGKVVLGVPELKKAIESYLSCPDQDSGARKRFLEQEITFLDGNAGNRTAEYLLSLVRAG